ncbi:MAG: hypothetical protein R3B70_28455 [Polyangiaceae bacterium]
MSRRARPVVSGLAIAFAALAVSAFAGCNGDPASIPISPEPPPRHEMQGDRANTFTIDYTPLGFKVAIAVPEKGQLCIIIPESAQDPAACLGIDPAAMTDALPTGPDRPFGVAYARMGDWSYIVMLTQVGGGVESKEQIEAFVAGAAKPDPALPEVVPQIIGPSPQEKYEILRVKDVPVVKFRLDAGVKPDDPNYDVSTMVHYAGFGGKSAMVSFITSPKDVDKLMPYADATIQSLVLPPHPAPERFGKPKSELEGGGFRQAITILGPLAAIGALLFWWLSTRKKDEPEASPKPALKAKPKPAPKRADEDADDEEEDEDSGER